MSEELTCPDCGGLIGVPAGNGVQVCRCFEPRRTAVYDAPPDHYASDDGESAATRQARTGEKLCRVCGRDLKGHRRLKDARGYVCVACDAVERRVHELTEAQDFNLIPCPECGRKLKSEGITTVDGAVMCRSCAVDYKEMHKYKGPPPALEKFDEEQKKSLKKLLIVAGVLGLIILLASIGLIGRR